MALVYVAMVVLLPVQTFAIFQDTEGTVFTTIVIALDVAGEFE